MGFWWGNLKGRDDLEGLNVGKNNIKINLKSNESA